MTNDGMEFLNKFFPEKLTPGKVVRSRRKSLDLTPQEIKELTGIDTGHLSRIENDKKPVGVKVAVILGAVLGVHPSTILFPEDDAAEIYVQGISEIREEADSLIEKKRAVG
ncbi:MAG: helix-turn-helix transcriptional regulator [Bacteriovoracaceae bacterium]|nr:helix-turn-helix transcriptional regulator [Bacteriovoracaceae bacterium]